LNHDAVYTPAGVNAGYHKHNSDSHYAPSHNAPTNADHAPHNAHTGPSGGHLPVPHNYPSIARTDGFANHSATYTPAGFNAGEHKHAAGVAPPTTIKNDPNAGNPYHTHEAGHHAAQTHHFHTPHTYNHTAGSHAPDPTDNHNHDATVNPGPANHGYVGYHSHNAQRFSHSSYWSPTVSHFSPSSPLYPSRRHFHHADRHNDGSARLENPDGSISHIYYHRIGTGTTPHGANPYPYLVGPPTPSGVKDPVPSPHNADTPTHHNSHHNAGSGEIHVPDSHHSPSGNHPAGDHAPDPTPTRDYPHSAEEIITHNSGHYNHGAGDAETHFANTLPDPIVARGHTPANTPVPTFGHTGSAYSGGYGSGHGEITSHVNAGNFDHGAGQADNHFANALPDPVVARGHTGANTPVPTFGHTGTNYSGYYPAGTGNINTHHTAGTHNHGAGNVDEHFGPYLPNTVLVRGHTPTSGTPSDNFGHSGTNYSGYYPAGTGNINTHHTAGTHNHGAGNVDEHFGPYLPNTVLVRGHTPTSGTPSDNFGHSGTNYSGYYPAGTGNINTHHTAGTHNHGAGNVDEHFGPYLPNTVLVRGHTPTSGTPSDNFGHSGTDYDGYWPAGQHNHATGPISPLNDPTTISVKDLSTQDFYGPTLGANGVGGGAHTGTVFGPGHNPGYHEGNVGFFHFVGKNDGTNFGAHVFDPSVTLIPKRIVESTGGTQNQISFTSGIHYHPAYEVTHATGEPATGAQHTGNPYPAGVNQSYENLFYAGGEGGQGGEGGVGGVVNSPASANPGYTGGISIVTRNKGNVENQIGHSNFSKIIDFDS